MELRPYQKECISTIEAQPPGAYLSQMATGLGKTVTFANLPRHGERMLILSHREELVEQPRKYFDCSYGIERATQRSTGKKSCPPACRPWYAGWIGLSLRILG